MHDIVLGGVQGMKFMQVPMNPKAYVGSTQLKTASANAYHLFLNDEAAFEVNPRFAYADLKRLCEGGLYFNVKYGAMTS